MKGNQVNIPEPSFGFLIMDQGIGFFSFLSRKGEGGKGFNISD